VHISATETISSLLRARARQHADHVFCRWQDTQITYRQLDARVDSLRVTLAALGLERGQRAALMLGHHPDHVVTLLALIRMGVVVVPMNPQLRGASVRHVLEHAQPHAVIAEAAYAEVLCSERPAAVRALWRNVLPPDAPPGSCVIDDSTTRQSASLAARDEGAPDDVVAICYTSGTTGPPKGVLVTDRMCRCAAHSSGLLSGIQAGDTPLFWDPLYHSFGIEVVILALTRPITLAMVERFSASNFWQWAAQAQATHMHYVGGVISLLLKQPPSAGDRRHAIRTAWGGGCPAELWRTFEQRFGVKIHDSFGMTETSALNLINTEGVPGCVGRPLPYFEARLVTESGAPAQAGELGELWIRGREPGLVTPGYFRDAPASARLLHNGWLRTGDLLAQDAQGRFVFYSRKKDCVRRRGENVSAWEVESVINTHPEVLESALVAVANELGDEDLKIFVRRVPGSALDALALTAWCAPRMPRFHIPRFVAFVDEFPKTPTQRIQKFALSRSTDDCHDTQPCDKPDGSRPPAAL